MQDKTVVQLDTGVQLPSPDTKMAMPSVAEAPYVAPTVVTSLMARRKAMKDLAELSRLTGKQYTL